MRLGGGDEDHSEILRIVPLIALPVGFFLLIHCAAP